MIAVYLLVAMLLLMAAGIPLVAVLAAVSALALFVSGGFPPMTVIQMAVFGMEKHVLLAIPLFILTGEMMNASGISKRLFDLASALVGHMHGGLAQINVVASLFMGGISGSSSADAALTSKTFVPTMIERGYSPGFSGAITAVSAMLSPLIPPSIQLILYGSIVGVSIGKLFIATIVPGILLAAALMIAVAVISIRRGYRGDHARAGVKEVLQSLASAGFALLLPVIIVFGIWLGIFTPTEAGAVAACYATAIGLFVYRTIKLRELPRILLDASVDTGVIMLIVGASASLTFFLTMLQLPQTVVGVIASTGGGPTVFLGLTVIVLLTAGMFIEATALILLAAPILAPVAQSLGIDLVHFGIVLVFAVMVGTITPPFGQSSFIVSSVARIPIEQIFRETMRLLPYVILILLLVTFVPATVMWVGALFNI